MATDKKQKKTKEGRAGRGYQPGKIGISQAAIPPRMRDIYNKEIVPALMKEFDFKKNDEWFLDCKQFHAYMEKVGRVVNENDNRKKKVQSVKTPLDSGVQAV